MLRWIKKPSCPASTSPQSTPPRKVWQGVADYCDNDKAQSATVRILCTAEALVFERLERDTLGGEKWVSVPVSVDDLRRTSSYYSASRVNPIVEAAILAVFSEIEVV